MAEEKHLNAAERIKKNKERRRKRRIILSIAIVLMIAAASAEVAVLMNMTSVDRRFMREVERGVIEGWTASRGDLQLKESGAVIDTSFIDEELEAAGEFVNKAYQDKTLRKLARRYVSDLKECRSVAAAHDPASDSDAFWEKFAAPYTDRLIVLRTLYTGDYKMGSGWDKYPEQRDEVLLKGWLAKTAADLKFEREKGKDGTDIFKTTLKNDSGFDLEYISIEVGVYDSKGDFYSNAEIYKEDIKNGSTAELMFYFTGSKASSYRVKGADCAAVPETSNTNE